MKIKFQWFVLLALAIAALGVVVAPTAAENIEGNRTLAPVLATDSPTAIPNQYIVVFKSDAAQNTVSSTIATVEALGGRIDYTYSAALNGFAGYLPEKALDAVRADRSVAYVEADQVVSIVDTQPNATWGLDRIDQRNLPLNSTYTYNYNGSGVTAYIVDTGIRTTHNDLGGRVAGGYTSINDGNGYNDCNGHGTHVSGTVGGSTYGVAKNVTFYAVRVLSCSGSGPTSGVIAGVDWVTSHHTAGQPAVANMSLGGSASTSMDNAVVNSINDGVTYAIAAGNSNANACNYSPARVSSAITVGATTSTDARASYSNYGTCLDIFAPGDNITSAWHTSDSATNTISGTSMASPHVAGVAALYLDENPSASPATVASAIINNATTGVVGNPGSGSPNRLLYSLFTGGGPTPTPPPGPTATPPSGSCSGSPDYTGSLSGTGDYDQANYSSGSGNQHLCLTGTGPDFDLYLYKRSGFFYSLVASSLGTTSTEEINYNGTSGTYRWRVRSYNGSGTYQLWVDHP